MGAVLWGARAACAIGFALVVSLCRVTGATLRATAGAPLAATGFALVSAGALALSLIGGGAAAAL